MNREDRVRFVRSQIRPSLAITSMWENAVQAIVDRWEADAKTEFREGQLKEKFGDDYEPPQC